MATSSPESRTIARITYGSATRPEAIVRDTPGLRTVISNVSAATGEQERIALFTVLLRDASLFYALGVAPRGDFSEYEGTFQRVVGSIQIMDCAACLGRICVGAAMLSAAR